MSDYVTKTNLLSALGRFKENTDDLYATEAELTSVKNACEARDSALDKRVTNLEQKAGDEIVVDYPSQTYGIDGVPANVAEYAKVTKLRGVSRVKNQRMNDYAYNASVSKSGSTVTVNWNGSTGDTKFGVLCSFPRGHVALVSVDIASISVQNFIKVRFGDGLSIITSVGKQTFIATPQNADSIALFVDASSFVSGDNFVYKDFIVTDLTQYFNGTIPTDADTIAEIQQNYPELLIPSDYDAGSIVDTEYSGIESISPNLLDMSLHNVVSGATYTLNEDGSLTIVNQTGSALSTSIPLTGSLLGGSYTIKNYSGLQAYVQIGSGSDYSHVVAVGSSLTFNYDGSSYLKLLFNNQTSNTTVTLKLKLEKGSTATEYSPYGVLDTLSLGQTVKLCAVSDTIRQTFDLETGVKDMPCKEIPIALSGNDGLHYTNVWYFVIAKPADYIGYGNYESVNTFKTRVKFPRYEIGRDYPTDSASNIGKITGDITPSSICVGFAPNTTLEQARSEFSGNWVYRLATPDSEQKTPILDPFIEVEGGGTIRPIQTQTQQIDSAMTAEYLSLGA